jgi:hypothetical protein
MSKFKKNIAAASLAIAATLFGSPAKAETEKQVDFTK